MAIKYLSKNELQIQIVDEIIEKIPNRIYSLINLKNVLNINDLQNFLLKQCFINNKDLNLSYTGYVLVKEIKEENKVDLPPNYVVKSSHIIYLNKYLTSPYFFQKKILSIFDVQEAFEFIMLDGDIEQFVQIKKTWEETLKSD